MAKRVSREVVQNVVRSDPPKHRGDGRLRPGHGRCLVRRGDV